MTHQIETASPDAELAVEALLDAIPTADAWSAVVLADELAEILFTLDAVPPEIEAAFNNVFRPTSEPKPFQKPD